MHQGNRADRSSQFQCGDHTRSALTGAGRSGTAMYVAPAAARADRRGTGYCWRTYVTCAIVSSEPDVSAFSPRVVRRVSGAAGTTLGTIRATQLFRPVPEELKPG